MHFRTYPWIDRRSKYTPQNNLRTTSFISLWLSLKCDTQVLKLFHGQNWKSQPYFNQLNMFATCSATKVSMTPTTPNQKILKTNKREFPKKKTTFTPKWSFFIIPEKSLFNENNTLSHTKSCKLNFHSSKRHTDMARKRDQPFERHHFWRENVNF